MMVSLAGAMSASAVELFWVGESQPQRFDTRMLAVQSFGVAVVHNGGRLTSDANWAANAVHIVYGTLVVETNVTLTIQAGTVVQFAGGGIYARGDCIANGVCFSDAASDEVVSYVLKGNVVTDEATTFRGRNYQDDFQRHSDSSSFAFDTRGLLGAAPSGTVVHWGGRLSENETWAAGQTHLVYGTVTVPTNVTLTVERGAVVKFAGGGIRADGSLVAEGAVFADLDDDSVGGDTRKDGWTQPHVSYAIDGEVYDDANTIYRCLDTHGEWLLDGASVASAFNTRGYDAADLAEAVTHAGVVTSDETWSADETHVVYGTLCVAAGVTLTIEPGAVVKFVGGGLVIDGRCVARGVTFTDLDDDSHGATRANAKLPEASYVLEGEIETDDATVMMCSKGKQNDLSDPGVSRVFRLETDLERVRFAGVPREVTFSTAWDGSTAVEVTETRPDGSTVVLTNGTADCAGVFLWDAGETPGLYTLRHVTDTNELSASFYRLFNATVHSGPLTGDMVWEANITHVVDGSLKVMSGATLLIEPGAVVKFVEGASLTVADGGSCVAKDVTFTPLGDDTVGGDTMFDGNATVPTQDAYVVNGVEDDETTEYRYMTPVSLITSGMLNKDATWKGWNVYRVTGDLTIASGVTLTIMPGAIVKFDDGKSLTVASGGTLNAIGTRAQPIVFTSVKDDTVGGDTNGDGDSSTPNPGDWSKISTSGGAANMAHVQILYSSKNSTTGAINMNGGTVTFVNGLIAHGLYDAIGVESGHFYMTNSVVHDCLVACRHCPRDPIVNCVFYDCGRLTQGGGQTFVNCIFSKITETWEAFEFPHATTYRNCCFWNEGGSVLTGEGRQDALTVCGKNGNVYADPLFEDPDRLDFRIKVGSPCFDAGDDLAAPARDHYNQPRNGQADIGIFELQYRPVKADVDLSLVSVTADVSATIGGTLNVTWTVENLGSANATGSWRDTFELIDASGATIRLGSYTVSGGIVAGGKRVFTTKFNVPSAAVGAARLRVKVNAERDVFEGMIMDNNVAYADGTIDLVLAAYTPEDVSSVTVGAGSSTAFTIPADSGITALIIKGGAGISAYGAYGYMPKALRNDSAAVRLEDGALLLTLPSTDGADDFIFVIANGGYGAETVSIEPVTESLEITEVTPNRLANTGDGYLTLRGVALDRVAKVRLVGGTTLAPTAFNAASSGELSATFPLADATPGAYALEVEDADGETYRLDAAVEIYKPKMGPKLEAHLEIPTAVRQGRIYTGKIVYSNVGDTDMYAPFFQITGVDTELSFDINHPFTDLPLLVLGVSQVHPAGILKVGESCELSFLLKVGANPSLKLEVCDDSGEEWLKSYSDAATRISLRGQPAFDVGGLSEFINEMAESDSFAVCGFYSFRNNAAPGGVTVSAFDADGMIVSCGQVDDYGRFTLTGLMSGETYFVGAEYCSALEEVTIPDNSDVYGLILTGEPVATLQVHVYGLSHDELEKAFVSIKTVLGTSLLCHPMAGCDNCELIVTNSDCCVISVETSTGNLLSKAVGSLSNVEPTCLTFDFQGASCIAGTVKVGSDVCTNSVTVIVDSVDTGFRRTVRCNDRGEYCISGLQSGDYIVTVLELGYTLESVRRVSITSESDHQENVDIHLSSTGFHITGGFPFSDGNYIAVLYDSTGTAVKSQCVNEGGQFSFLVDSGDYGVRAISEDGISLSKLSSVHLVDRSIDVVLQSIDYAQLTVKLTNGTASVSGVVEIELETGNSIKIDVPEAGAHVLVPKQEGYWLNAYSSSATSSSRYLITNGRATDVVIDLQQSGFIAGKIDEIADGALVEFIQNGKVIATSRANAEGRFVSKPLLVGEYEVSIFQGKTIYDSGVVCVCAGMTNDVPFRKSEHEIFVELDNEFRDVASFLSIEDPITGYRNVVSYDEDGGVICIPQYISSGVVNVRTSKGTVVGCHRFDRDTTQMLLTGCSVVSSNGCVFTENITDGVIRFYNIETQSLSETCIYPNGEFIVEELPMDYTCAEICLRDGRTWLKSRNECESMGYQLSCNSSDLSEVNVVVMNNSKDRTRVNGLCVKLADQSGKMFLCDAKHCSVSPGNYTLFIKRDGVFAVVSNIVLKACYDKAIEVFLEEYGVDMSVFVKGTEARLQATKKVTLHAASDNETPEVTRFFKTNRDKEFNQMMWEANTYYLKYKNYPSDYPCSHNIEKYENWVRAKDNFLRAAENAYWFLEVIAAQKAVNRTESAMDIAGCLPGLGEGIAIGSLVRAIIDGGMRDTAEEIRNLLISLASLQLKLYDEVEKMYEANQISETEKAVLLDRAALVEKLDDQIDATKDVKTFVRLQKERNFVSNRYWELFAKITQKQKELTKALKIVSENPAVRKAFKSAGYALEFAGDYYAIKSTVERHFELKDMESGAYGYDAEEGYDLKAAFLTLKKAWYDNYHMWCFEFDEILEKLKTVEEDKMNELRSCDPNEMAGPMGVGDPETERFVKPGEWLTYTVYFENQSNATAAAQEVYVTNPLSEWLDLDSFEMGEVAFNNQIDLGLVGKQNGSCETDLAGTAYRVRSNVTLDKDLSTVGWYLRIVDPTTPAEWPEDPYAGLLPPNDETHCGEGHLTYRIRVREDAPRNVVITNAASIVFDYNEAIETDPFWWNVAGWPFTLGEAVNNEALEWTTGGAAEWLQTWDDCAADGQHDAVVTGIGNNTNAWIKTVVEGPGTVSFAWCGAVASRNTKVQLLVDGAVEAILSGSNDWERVSVTVYGEREHELEWKMQTGRSGASADDFVALDCVEWTPTPPPTLAEALNADLVWSVDGDADWHGVARDSLVSTREAWASVCGLGDFEYAAVVTRVYGSGTLRFDWAVSCEEVYDELVLVVDGKPRKSISGEIGWMTDAVEISGKAWHEVRWEYVKDEMDELELVGDNCAWLDDVVWDSDHKPLIAPTVVDDEGATVTGDAETGFVVKPSEGKTAVEVSIPGGIDAGQVTVEVSVKVTSVKSNGAKVKIVSGGADITEFLDLPPADGSGVVDLSKAMVKKEIVNETMDVEKGAEIELNAADPKLTTPKTRVGLFYQLREGVTIEGMEDGDSKIGDGQPWTPEIKVKGGNSAFYSIGVGKGE